MREIAFEKEVQIEQSYIMAVLLTRSISKVYRKHCQRSVFIHDWNVICIYEQTQIRLYRSLDYTHKLLSASLRPFLPSTSLHFNVKLPIGPSINEMHCRIALVSKCRHATRYFGEIINVNVQNLRLLTSTIAKWILITLRNFPFLKIQ